MPPIPAARRQSIIAIYEAARADGHGVEEAAKLAGASHCSVLRWIEEAAADALVDDIPAPVAKKRRCLRCGQMFYSASAGNRICGRFACRHEYLHAGLPDAWGGTPTVTVAD